MSYLDVVEKVGRPGRLGRLIEPLQISFIRTKNMTKMAILAASAMLAFGSAPAMAKDKIELSPLQLQAMQTKEFEAAKEPVFASVMSVLQDAGYRIENADLATGLITGIGSSKGKMVYSQIGRAHV